MLNSLHSLFLIIIIIIDDGRCPSAYPNPHYERVARLSILLSMIGGCHTNAEWREVRFTGPEPGVTRSGRREAPVPCQRSQAGAGADGLTVVHGCVSTCNVAEELRQVARMMCVSGGWSVRRRTSSLETRAHQGICII